MEIGHVKPFQATERFSYDNIDRLTAINGAVSKTQSYEADGRITENSDLGAYNYDPNNRYRLKTMDLNEKGQAYYGQHTKQEVTYNAFKKPVEVHEKGQGRVSFQYGPLMGRSHAYYGGEEEDKLERRYRKYYSSIVPVEIVQDRETGTDKIITYVHGGPYDAPAVHIKQTGNNSSFYYLHRDYLGSILAITNIAGSLAEQRHFGSWGTVDYFSKGLQKSEFNHENSLLSRGYTGHEHFFSVGLIHMNGRMYDSNLGRFLSPDDHIQEPFSTQNYNRYSYVSNNPLTFVDPDGRCFRKAENGGEYMTCEDGNIGDTRQGAFGYDWTFEDSGWQLTNGADPSTVNYEYDYIEPSGDADYYINRYKNHIEKYNTKPSDYYLGYGHKYINRFKNETRKKLSNLGQEWLDETAVALQKLMNKGIDQSVSDPETNRLQGNNAAFTSFAYKTHPTAYKRGKKIEKLNESDLLNIFMTIDPKDSFLSPDGRSQIKQILPNILKNPNIQRDIILIFGLFTLYP